MQEETQPRIIQMSTKMKGMKQRTAYQVRERRIELIKSRLMRKSMPRLQMSLLLLLAGLAGFLASFFLLTLDVSRMWLRYPIAIFIAYGVFLLLLHLWLKLHGRPRHTDFELPEVDLVELPTSGPGEGLPFVGSDSSDSSFWSAIGFDLDLEELGLLIIALVALIGGLIASLYIVYIAPVLFAEILIDGVLLVGLYKRVKKVDQRHWLRAAVRRTIVPILLVALFFSVAGYAMQKAIPAAHSIGDVLAEVTTDD